MSALFCLMTLYISDLLSTLHGYGCVVLFTGWIHRCIRLEHSDASLMHRWNQLVNKTTHPLQVSATWRNKVTRRLIHIFVSTGSVKIKTSAERVAFGSNSVKNEMYYINRSRCLHYLHVYRRPSGKRCAPRQSCL